MKYSVVIPLYNKAHYIEKTLNSVLQQTYQDFEIIVVDDGSTDHSLEAAQRVKSDKIRVISQKNQGVSVARNTGIQNAKGSYIAFLDADDIWYDHYMETIDQLTLLYPESDFYVTAYAINLGEGKMKYSQQREQKTGCLDSYWKTLAGGYDFVWTSATTVRKQALLDAGCFTPGEKIGQDMDMWARVARNNKKVAYSSEYCVEYNRLAEENARTRVKIAWARAFIRDLEEELENPDHSPEELAAIQSKYDKKMTVYIFTCIMEGEKKRALTDMKSWKGKNNRRNVLLRMGLLGASIMPTSVNRWVYGIRLKVF